MRKRRSRLDNAIMGVTLGLAIALAPLIYASKRAEGRKNSAYLELVSAQNANRRFTSLLSQSQMKSERERYRIAKEMDEVAASDPRLRRAYERFGSARDAYSRFAADFFPRLYTSAAAGAVLGAGAGIALASRRRKGE